MSDVTKKQSEQHIIDAQGQLLLRSHLPKHWVLREYRPDYGIDFSLEIFAEPKEPNKLPHTYETLGEHLFIQLKSVGSIDAKPLKIYARGNVEKQREILNKNDPPDVIDTIRFQLETSELSTVERMGVGVPVLLVVADLSKSKCFFVCLNDYIDKILIPKHYNYKSTGSRTIHIPFANQIGQVEPGQIALRWYAKRAKLYAAFQRFIYQQMEIQYAQGSPGLKPMADYFARRILSYDFWSDTEMWRTIEYYGNLLKKFRDDKDFRLMALDEVSVMKAAEGDEIRAQELRDMMRAQDIPELWRLLTILPRNYEEVCREWFLPTSLGYACSY